MKKFKITVNGKSYEVEVDEIENATSRTKIEHSQPTPQVKDNSAGPVPIASTAEPIEEKKIEQGQEIVDTPMPGNIWKILVNEGDKVNEGDTLLILEAMKMENDIVAPRNGVVASIAVDPGMTVGMGDTLVILE